jgi:hypothetical protein
MPRVYYVRPGSPPEVRQVADDLDALHGLIVGEMLHDLCSGAFAVSPAA